MWMMGYHDDFNNLNPDSFNGRKLRPLIPRPPPAGNNPLLPSPAAPPCMTRIHALNHHLAAMAEHGKCSNVQSSSAAAVVVSSRWNPTPEQLRTLEELYRRGTRTPSADQIQHITAQLRRYGKIEGKNVFYWFQNHKARERQKRRRQMEAPVTGDHEDNNSCSGGGSSRVAGVEAEQNKNCSTHCTTTPPEEESSGPTKAAGDHGWSHIATATMRRNATWHSIQLPCPLPPARVFASTAPPSTKRVSPREGYLDIFIYNNTDDHRESYQDQDHDQDQTLELFPLRSENATEEATCNGEKVMDQSSPDNNNNQFFEFLPLKN